MKVKIRAKVNLSRPVCCIRDAALPLPPSLPLFFKREGEKSVIRTEDGVEFLIPIMRALIEELAASWESLY